MISCTRIYFSSLLHWLESFIEQYLSHKFSCRKSAFDSFLLAPSIPTIRRSTQNLYRYPEIRMPRKENFKYLVKSLTKYPTEKQLSMKTTGSMKCPSSWKKVLSTRIKNRLNFFCRNCYRRHMSLIWTIFETVKHADVTSIALRIGRMLYQWPSIQSPMVNVKQKKHASCLRV